jgi:hypothetical protein
VGPTAGLEVLEKRKSLVPTETWTPDRPSGILVITMIPSSYIVSFHVERHSSALPLLQMHAPFVNSGATMAAASLTRGCVKGKMTVVTAAMRAHRTVTVSRNEVR